MIQNGHKTDFVWLKVSFPRKGLWHKTWVIIGTTLLVNIMNVNRFVHCIKTNKNKWGLVTNKWWLVYEDIIYYIWSGVVCRLEQNNYVPFYIKFKIYLGSKDIMMDWIMCIVNWFTVGIIGQHPPARMLNK